MKQALMQTFIDLQDDPLWQALQAEAPAQQVSTQPMVSTYAANILAELAKDGTEVNYRNRLHLSSHSAT